MAKKIKKKVPLGKPLPKISDSYEEQIPVESEVMELVSTWDEFAPVGYKGLLSAENLTVLEQTGQKPKAKFIWDDVRKRYIEVRTGRVLTRADLHQALSSFVDAYSKR